MADSVPTAAPAAAEATSTVLDNSHLYAEDGSLLPQEESHAAPAKEAKKEKPLIEQVKTGEAEAPEKKEPPAPPKKKHLLKAKGKQLELDDEQVLHYAQKAFGSEQMYEEAKRMREEAQTQAKKLEALKDPKTRKQALRELMGEDFDAIAEETTYERYNREQQLSQLTERERIFYQKLEEKDALLQQMQAKEQAQTRAREEARSRATYDGIAQQIEGSAMEAINGLKLPPHLRPQMAQRILPYIEAAIDTGTPIEPQALATFAMNDMREEYAFLTNNLEGEALVNWLGPQVAKKIRLWDLAQLRGKKNAPQEQPTRQVQQEKRSPSGRPAWDEIEELIKGG